jgi:hypothetical protein
MRVRTWAGAMLIAGTLSATGCGGDNLELCDGCGTPVPTVTLTPTPGTPTVTTTPAPSTSPATSPSTETSPEA